MRFTIPLFIALSTLTGIGCDPATNDAGTVRERLGVALDGAEISLAEAIQAAQKAAPGAVVLEAELDVHTDKITYDIELLDGDAEREIDVSPKDGSILSDRSEVLDADDLAEAQAAAKLVSASVGWVEILGKAEAEAGGDAFEVEADGEDGVLEVELIVGDTVWETEHAADGSITKSEKSDDQRDDDSGEHEDEIENEGPDDDN